MHIKDNPPFESGHFYHVFNRGNNREPIFFSEENRRYFLFKFGQYINDYLDVFAYCLLPNHFHFLVRVKEELPSSESDFPLNLPGFENLEGLSSQSLGSRSLNASGLSPTRRCRISQALSNFLNAYAKAINKQENRTGSLFQKRCKRILVDNESYLIAVIYYIHNNPVHHNLTGCLQDYRWSSYKRILASKTTKLKKQEVLDLFGGAKHYTVYHQQKPDWEQMVEQYLIE